MGGFRELCYWAGLYYLLKEARVTACERAVFCETGVNGGGGGDKSE